MQYHIIKDACDHPTVRQNPDAAHLKRNLVASYGHLEAPGSQFDDGVADETCRWLAGYPKSGSLYEGALRKQRTHVPLRNLLDDLRLALEKLMQELLSNHNSLEKQVAPLGAFVKQRGGSTEVRNMVSTLLDYYTKYQNTYVKHDDAVIEHEVEFIFELTSLFMKHLVRLSARDPVQ